MQLRLAAPLQKDSIVDGEGIRAVLWTQGCLHNCPGCHNPTTHDMSKGTLIDLEEVYSWLDNLEYHDGITLSGGDPMYQASACAAISKYAHSLGLNVWCYTGFTYEDLIKLNNDDINELLNNIDVLIDGPFILSKKSYDATFRGSTNQRLIDIKKTIQTSKVTTLSAYDTKGQEYNTPLKRTHMYI